MSLPHKHPTPPLPDWPGVSPGEHGRPVPRASLSRRTRVLLWTVRILVIILGALVVYTFVAQLA